MDVTSTMEECGKDNDSIQHVIVAKSSIDSRRVKIAHKNREGVGDNEQYQITTCTLFLFYLDWVREYAGPTVIETFLKRVHITSLNYV